MVAFKSSFVLLALFVSAMALPMPQETTKPFTKQNGLDAISLNDKFATLSPNSPCTSGQDGCVGGKFAQCVNGAFVTSNCAAGTVCAALPLVNSPGTSIACTTEADKNARIAATGATSTGPAGSADAAAVTPAANTPTVTAAASPAPAAAPSAAASGSKSFTLQNGKDAQALNAKFAGLTPSSPCTPGENACVKNQFAQCANGQFVLTPCSAGLQCAALPLVNSPGTSITCVDQAQALARIDATGAGDSLTGN